MEKIGNCTGNVPASGVILMTVQHDENAFLQNERLRRCSGRIQRRDADTRSLPELADSVSAVLRRNLRY